MTIQPSLFSYSLKGRCNSNIHLHDNTTQPIQLFIKGRCNSNSQINKYDLKVYSVHSWYTDQSFGEILPSDALKKNCYVKFQQIPTFFLQQFQLFSHFPIVMKLRKSHFVQCQDQYLTLLFISSFVLISHLTNFLSYSMFMYVACFFCLTLPLRKNLLGQKHKAIN